MEVWGDCTMARPRLQHVTQGVLWSAVLEKGANVDRRHHCPFSCFWLFDAETFEEVHQGRGETIKLDICKENAVKENENFWRARVRSLASHLCRWRP